VEAESQEASQESLHSVGLGKLFPQASPWPYSRTAGKADGKTPGQHTGGGGYMKYIYCALDTTAALVPRLLRQPDTRARLDHAAGGLKEVNGV
jgi:hypothetical protein